MNWTDVHPDALVRALLDDVTYVLLGCNLMILIMTATYQGLKRRPNLLLLFLVFGTVFALFDSGLLFIGTGYPGLKVGEFNRFRALDHGELLVYRWIFWALLSTVATLWFCRTIDDKPQRPS